VRRQQSFLCAGACVRAQQTPGARASLVRTGPCVAAPRAHRTLCSCLVECLCSNDVCGRKAARHDMEEPPDKQGTIRGCTCTQEYGLSCENNVSFLEQDRHTSIADKRPQLLPSRTCLQHVQCLFWRGSECVRVVLSETTLSWQCSSSTTNTISEVLLFSVCVCYAIYIYMLFLKLSSSSLRAST
jgi:hypothetical protein